MLFIPIHFGFFVPSSPLSKLLYTFIIEHVASFDFAFNFLYKNCYKDIYTEPLEIEYIMQMKIPKKINIIPSKKFERFTSFIVHLDSLLKRKESIVQSHITERTIPNIIKVKYVDIRLE